MLVCENRHVMTKNKIFSDNKIIMLVTRAYNSNTFITLFWVGEQKN